MNCNFGVPLTEISLDFDVQYSDEHSVFFLFVQLLNPDVYKRQNNMNRRPQLVVKTLKLKYSKMVKSPLLKQLQRKVKPETQKLTTEMIISGRPLLFLKILKILAMDGEDRLFQRLQK